MQKFGRFVVIVLSLLLVLVVVLLLSKLNQDSKENDKLIELKNSVKVATKSDSSSETEVNVSDITYLEKLHEKNEDCIGWITIEACGIDYPVMYSPHNPEFYLKANFDKEYSGIGTPYVDAFCTPLGKDRSDNVIIYGHNISSGEIFHYLDRYEEESFYEENKYFRYDTLEGPGLYEVIAAIRFKAWDAKDTEHYRFLSFFDAKNEEDFNTFVSNAKELTPYETADAKYGDDLVMLSTCAYHEVNGRFAIIAKKVSSFPSSYKP